MARNMEQVIVLTLLTVLVLILITLGVFMEQAINNLLTALNELQTVISNIPNQVDYSAQIQGTTDALVEITKTLKEKFPTA
jgi:predicted PurR-regulated permease PerM